MSKPGVLVTSLHELSPDLMKLKQNKEYHWQKIVMSILLQAWQYDMITMRYHGQRTFAFYNGLSLLQSDECHHQSMNNLVSDNNIIIE